MPLLQILGCLRARHRRKPAAKSRISEGCASLRSLRLQRSLRPKPDSFSQKEMHCHRDTAKSDDSYSFPLFIGNPKVFLTFNSWLVPTGY